MVLYSPRASDRLGYKYRPSGPSLDNLMANMVSPTPVAPPTRPVSPTMQTVERAMAGGRTSRARSGGSAYGGARPPSDRLDFGGAGGGSVQSAPVADNFGAYSMPPEPPPINYGFGADQVDPTAGDDIFAGTQNSLARALAQFLASQEREKGLIESNAVEQTEGLTRQKGIDIRDLLENFAGRGMAYSGRYVDDDRSMGEAYARRLLAVQEGKKNQFAAQSERKADFEEDQRLAIEQARAESLARRLAAQGLG